MPEETEFVSGDAVAVVDSQLRVIGWNPAAEALTGTFTAAAVGRHCWEVLGDPSQPADALCGPGCSLAVRALQEGDVTGRSTLIATRLGTRRVWMATVTARSGGRARIVHVFHCDAVLARPAGADRLTSREREVLSLLAEGLPAAAIATRLGIGVTTVRTHIRHVLAALGVHSQLAAVVSTCEPPAGRSYDPDRQS